MVVTDLPLRVDEVMRGPVFVAERFPDGVIVVECDRAVDAQVLHGLRDVLRIFLEGEFGRVHADHTRP